MKKKILIGISVAAFLMMLALNVSVEKNVMNGGFTLKSLMTTPQAQAEFCYSGGPGSNSCSIEAGIDIAGYGVAGGCSVSCDPGYYSCCSLRCVCEKK